MAVLHCLASEVLPYIKNKVMKNKGIYYALLPILAIGFSSCEKKTFEVGDKLNPNIKKIVIEEKEDNAPRLGILTDIAPYTTFRKAISINATPSSMVHNEGEKALTLKAQLSGTPAVEDVQVKLAIELDEAKMKAYVAKVFQSEETANSVKLMPENVLLPKDFTIAKGTNVAEFVLTYGSEFENFANAEDGYYFLSLKISEVKGADAKPSSAYNTVDVLFKKSTKYLKPWADANATNFADKYQLLDPTTLTYTPVNNTGNGYEPSYEHLGTMRYPVKDGDLSSTWAISYKQLKNFYDPSQGYVAEAKDRCFVITFPQTTDLTAIRIGMSWDFNFGNKGDGKYAELQYQKEDGSWASYTTYKARHNRFSPNESDTKNSYLNLEFYAPLKCKGIKIYPKYEGDDDNILMSGIGELEFYSKK